MTDKLITDLSAASGTVAADLIPIYDVSAAVTVKDTLTNVLGLVTQTSLVLVPGTDVFKQRTFAGTSGVFTWTNGDGVSGAPSLALSAKRPIAQISRVTPSQTLGATPGVVTGASVPAESFACWDFDPSTIWYLDIFGVMTGILPASTGCTLKFLTVSAATSNAFIFNAAFRRLPAVDWDSTAFTSTYASIAQASATITTSATAGTPTAASISFSTGTNMNSVVAGDAFILRLWRDATNGSDTCASNIRVLEASIYIEEA